MSTVLQIANGDRNLTTLMKGLKAANLEEALNKRGPFTIFAPVNLAFGKLVPDSFDELIRPGNETKLSDILNYHVLAEKRLHKDLINGQKLKTVNGQDVTVSIANGEVRINGAKILTRDRQGSNGVVHSVDSVNIPS